MDDRSDARAAEWDCAQLLTRFFNAFDAFRYDEMVDLFLPDGVWHRQGKALTGRAMILEALHARSRTQTVRHVITNIAINLTGRDRAQSLLYLLAYIHDAGEVPMRPPEIAGPSLLLSVPGSLVRAEEGWRIADLAMNWTFTFPTAQPQDH